MSDTFQTFHNVTHSTFPDTTRLSSKSFRTTLDFTAIQAVRTGNLPEFPLLVENGESLDYLWNAFHQVFLQTKEEIYLLQYLPNVKNWDHSEICYP